MKKILVDAADAAARLRPLGVVMVLAMSLSVSAFANEKQNRKKKRTAAVVASAGIATGALAGPAKAGGVQGLDAEARLLQIYQMIGQGRAREALPFAEKLAAQHPNFALAQLVVGDLLVAQTQGLRGLGNVPEAIMRATPGTLTDLREESLQRLRALRERPAVGAVPINFVRLTARNRHAIAIDASRSRVYLFENGPQGVRLVADYYASIGKMGFEKIVEGDLKTPLGIYFITSSLDPKSLKDFYGAGALPINYPNPYDQRRGKTGSGIWLHGVPQDQFARAPKATDGCVVVSNPDLLDILRRVETRTTPVVILPKIEWVNPAQSNADVASFDHAFAAWRDSKAAGDVTRTLAHYASDFDSNGKTLADWKRVVARDIEARRATEVKDMSVLYWPENAQTATMVTTFSEVAIGSKRGTTKRQYWIRNPASQNQWKIFFERDIG